MKENIWKIIYSLFYIMYKNQKWLQENQFPLKFHFTTRYLTYFNTKDLKDRIHEINIIHRLKQNPILEFNTYKFMLYETIIRKHDNGIFTSRSRRSMLNSPFWCSLIKVPVNKEKVGQLLKFPKSSSCNDMFNGWLSCLWKTVT